ncbi:hypothetical protein MJO29_009529 [Puccinia striiformis f. sp. tritici]|uniref:Uncharacterized protein n=1 Tax=Puccinia striiformis f. sp. tritici PST-78 TaxID=1165861 RepID=A0A0L0V7W8_9BASI|nr:hypothetical protein MJO29_009529 [Puccinia striiformis f. sp. tritici]KNE95373.1 hypothetical protein PSTG_11226 [Puccinia striiformis f. sp. tritici PST-78]
MSFLLPGYSSSSKNSKRGIYSPPNNYYGGHSLPHKPELLTKKPDLSYHPAPEHPKYHPEPPKYEKPKKEPKYKKPKEQPIYEKPKEDPKYEKPKEQPTYEKLNKDPKYSAPGYGYTPPKQGRYVH